MNDIEKNNQIIEVKAEQLAKRIEALVVEARFFQVFSKSATPQRILARNLEGRTRHE